MNDPQALPWWQQSRVQYIAIALLIALMLFVVFALPQLVGPVEINPQDAANSAPGPVQTAPVDSPFADAQLARERKAAQEILSKVLQLQDQLEGQRVLDWDPQAYQAALDTAFKADEYYRQRAFSTAQEHYQSALAQLQALKNATGAALDTQLALGQQALDAKDAAAANTAFELALALDPNNPAAQTGKQSAEALDSVLDLLRKGRLEEKTDHWEAARDHYQAALALDPNSPLARAAVQEITTKIRDRNFTQAMSAGFKALDSRAFSDARAHFLKAAKIKPSDPSVDVALQQVGSQSLHASITRTLADARQAEAQERWQAANNLYRSLLEKDSTLVDAMVGKLRTDARAELAQRTAKILDNALQLNKPANLQAAQQTLQDLESLGDGGPHLEQQRQALRELLTQVTLPRQVILESDNLTQVTIYHVGRIGNFEQHVLSLRPGTYVAVGSRPGYRDVREEFTVALEASQITVTIRCTEKIALGS